MDENQVPEVLGPLAVLFGGMFFLVWCAVMLVIIAAVWKVFAKAGKPGWAAIIPIYNIYVLLEIVGRPWWWMLLLLVPLLGIVIAFVIAVDLARSFGKSAGFGVGLALLGSDSGELAIGGQRR
jgi:hypothetical protein